MLITITDRTSFLLRFIVCLILGSQTFLAFDSLVGAQDARCLEERIRRRPP